MRKLAVLILAFLLASPLIAQQATLTTPETITGTVVKYSGMCTTRTSATITIEIQQNDGTPTRTQSYTTVSLAEFTNFSGAIGSTRATETGSALRKMQFRIIGWLADNGHIYAPDGQTPLAVTVVP